MGVAFLLALPLGPVRAEDLEAAKSSVVRIVSKPPDGIERVGTGFVVRVEADLAYIATASHVVEGDPAPEIEFLARRNRPVKASIVRREGGDPKGLALLLVRGLDVPEGLQALTFAPSSDVRSGQEVVVIGFGQGQRDWTVIHASIASMQGSDLRLDGRIEEGNSGGPVLRDARVVALVTGVSQGFGVATPSLIVEAVFKGWGTDVSASPARKSNLVQNKNADLAAKGEAIANQDPLAVALRNQQPEGPARRGFDIGMAAAEGQTAPGPGKQSIHDSLPAAEQGGFTAAVSFSLARNKNAKLAATGAAITDADPIVAQSRNAEADPFYRLGFDIATGIFGDPAQGALGNTATGPGSLGIRDSLSAAGQRGFNAAVTFHLSRKYR